MILMVVQLKLDTIAHYITQDLPTQSLIKILILNFILYIFQVYCTLIYKQYEKNEKM
jgi:hypothetical protein